MRSIKQESEKPLETKTYIHINEKNTRWILRIEKIGRFYLVHGYRNRYYINGTCGERGTRLYQIESIDGLEHAMKLFAAYQAKYPEAIFKNTLKETK